VGGSSAERVLQEVEHTKEFSIWNLCVISEEASDH
jgi:hypothetical protein